MAYMNSLPAKKGVIADIKSGAEVLDSPTITTGAISAITSLVSMAAAAGGHLTVTGADGYDIIFKLGDDDGTETFEIQEVDGNALFKVESQYGNITTVGTITMGTTKALTLDTITAITGKTVTLTGADGYDVIVKLGDDDGTETFEIQEVDGNALFKVESQYGTITMFNGATIANASADTLTITEPNVDIVGDLTPSTLTMATTTAITADTFNSISGKVMQFTGADGYNIAFKLGDDDATESFIIEEVDGDDLFKVASDGQITLKGGATLDNKTAADTLTITEDKIGLTGAVTITGATVADGITCDSITSTAGEALEITGADGFDVKVTLGDDDGTESFIVEEVDGDDLFKVDSLGGITLKGGATLDNKTAADTLTVTEDNISLVGATAVTGAATVSSTLGVTGIATVGGLETTHTSTGLNKAEKLAVLSYTYADDNIVTLAAAWNPDTDVVTTGTHGWTTGMPVDLTTTDADLPNGTSVDTAYYIYAASTSTIQLYDTYAHAQLHDGTGLINFTDIGTGSHTIWQGRFGEIRTALTMPDNAIVTGGLIDVTTAFTDDDAGSNNTTALSLNSANDVFSAANLTAGLKDTVPVNTAATSIKMSGATTLVLTVATDQLGAGSMKVYLYYLQSI